MKKLFLTLALVFGVSAASVAQPRAVGLHFGYGMEASYQHSVNYHFIEADLGLFENTFAGHAMFDFVVASPTWTSGEWNVYVGPGLGFDTSKKSAHFSVCAQAGLEYTFNIPIQLSIDIRPDIMKIGTKEEDINSNFQWFRGWWPTLGFRYRF